MNRLAAGGAMTSQQSSGTISTGSIPAGSIPAGSIPAGTMPAGAGAAIPRQGGSVGGGFNLDGTGSVPSPNDLKTPPYLRNRIQLGD